MGRDGLKRYKEAAPFISSSPHVGQNDIRFIRLIVESTDPSWKKEMQIEFTDYITALDNECVMTHGERESANVQVHLKPHAERSDATVKKIAIIAPPLLVLAIHAVQRCATCARTGGHFSIWLP